ncbi:hypothetical protein NECID01_0611 [Nematocida sp. AWRm77]|nr:hypothetical protein NECID01_0611 [Nematocida sp. AWRm77]
MQIQTTLLRQEETIEHEILLQGTIKALKEATVEVSSVQAIVGAQGELIEKIQQKVLDAENTLKKASKVLTHLMQRSRKRKAISFCLLAVVTTCVLSLITLTLFKR